MTWFKRDASLRHGTKLIALNVGGGIEPEVYRVSADIFTIVGKMLSANQLTGAVSGSPIFDFSEVRFLLKLLGAPFAGFCPEAWDEVGLCISELES